MKLSRHDYLTTMATAWYQFRLLKLITLCLAAALVAAGVVWIAERGVAGSEYHSYGKTLRNITVLLFSGWDIAPPQTSVGFWGAFAALLFGIIFVASITAEIASVWVEQRINSSGEVASVNCSDHIVICNNTPHLPMAVEQLLDPECTAQGPLVVLAEDVPAEIAALKNVLFVQGDPTIEEDLRRAGVHRADVLIVLATDLTDPRASDSEVLLAVLAAEDLNPSIYSVAQVGDSANAKHLQRAGVDEIVSAGEIGAKLAIQASVRPGLSRFIDSLLTFDENGEFYSVPAPDEYAGQAPQTVMQRLYTEHKCTLVGIVRNGQMHMLVSLEDKIQRDDELVLIAASPPDLA